MSTSRKRVTRTAACSTHAASQPMQLQRRQTAGLWSWPCTIFLASTPQGPMPMVGVSTHAMHVARNESMQSWQTPTLPRSPPLPPRGGPVFLLCSWPCPCSSHPRTLEKLPSLRSTSMTCQPCTLCPPLCPCDHVLQACKAHPMSVVARRQLSLWRPLVAHPTWWSSPATFVSPCVCGWGRGVVSVAWC